MKLSAQKQNAIGLLLLRLVFAGTLLYGHGWGKLMGWSERSAVFPDPIGLGSPVALALAIGAEVFCALLVIFGLFTRVAALPVIITMLVIIGIVHAGDPFGKIELPLLFLTGFTAIAIMGAGDFSIDALLKKRRATTIE